ncbi:MAG: shikimate dehydrogenase [Acidobacteriaceae bacterium]|nr:shikimate dehydrogenase [Acidobacteriaceae bacterium]
MDSLPDELNLDFLPAITGSFSTPSRQNPTVEMVEAAYRHHKIHARYLNCEVLPADLENAIKGAKAMQWLGFNCSIPHKINVMRYLDGLGTAASLIGAVNCVVNRNGILIGENTDGAGFLISLQHVTTLQNKEFVLYGAGGAARAIAVEIALAGARTIHIVNRERSRGEELVKLINDKTSATAIFHDWHSQHKVPESADVVINATSVGFYPDTDAMINIDTDTLLPSMIVADVIPNPPHTALLRAAEQRGCKTLDGLGMLVYQGVAGIKHWTGKDVDPSIMRKTLERIFNVQ